MAYGGATRAGFSSNLWIIARSKKTNTESNIRLLEVPKHIIEKYKGITGDNRVFPVPSNSSCNEKLKKIGTQCGIKTRLTFHSPEHEKWLKTDHSTAKIEPSTQNEGRLRLMVDGVSISRWLKQKHEEQYPRPQVKEPQRQNRGMGIKW